MISKMAASVKSDTAMTEEMMEGLGVGMGVEVAQAEISEGEKDM